MTTAGVYADCTVLKEYDELDDGTVESISEQQFDGYGNEVMWRADRDVDGKFEWIIVYTRNERGDIVRRDYDNDGDNDPDGYELYDYDNVGRLTSQRHYRLPSLQFDSATYYQYARGFVITRIDEDNDGDGDPDRITYHQYDALQRLLLTQVDEDGNGTIDNAVAFSWIDARMTRAEHSENGVLLWFDLYYYNDQNLIERIQTYAHDRLYSEVSYVYNAAGLEVLRRLFVQGHLESELEQQYDALGRLTLRRLRYLDSVDYAERFTNGCRPSR